MENKINIAQLLKDCPQGMELDCLIFEDVTLYSIDTDTENEYPIRIVTKNGYFLDLTKYGTYSNVAEAKCVIFPKGKTTWEGFEPPCKFKDGDIVFYNDTIAIFKEWGDETLFRTYVTKYLCCDSLIDMNVPLFGKSVRKEIRLATEEEKEKLFQAIKDNGYKWNAETKTLEKLVEPKFKVGDMITNGKVSITISHIDNNYYYTFGRNVTHRLFIKNQDDWKLVPNKFDITTLKPFDKVLVRQDVYGKWGINFFGFYNYDEGYYYTTGNWIYKQCIPYEGNEYLLDTNNDCDDYYKTW